jgi:hypothetical protein
MIATYPDHACTKDEWLTPKHLVDSLGPFDLDPCAPPPERRLWSTAKQHYSLPDDGLVLPWFGRVWLNPPYGNQLGTWMERLARHGNGIALIFARTETRAFQDWVWPLASALLFVDGRISFHQSGTGALLRDGGAPSVFVAYDQGIDLNAARLRDAGIEGAWLDTRKGLVMVPTRTWSTWRDLVCGILRQRGPMTLGEVYQAVECRGDLPESNRHVRDKVRQQLYLHASRGLDNRWMAA